MALRRYGIGVAVKNKFVPMIHPTPLRHEALLGALNDIKDFEDIIYKIENEDSCLMGTAERALITMLCDKVRKV